MLEEWMEDVEVRPRAAEVESFLRELWDQVPDLRDLFGEVPDRDQLGSQLEQMGSAFGPLQRLPESARPKLGELRREVERRLDELMALPDVELPGTDSLPVDELRDLRDRWFGGGDGDQQDDDQRDEDTDRGGDGND